MDERVVQFRVGAMVLATLLITGILVVMFGELPKLRLQAPYKVYVRFNEAPGVAEGTPVRKSGIVIGRVTDIKFASDVLGPNERGVIVTAEIDADRKIYRNEVCRVKTSLLGDAELRFELGQKPTAETTPYSKDEFDINNPLPGEIIYDPARVITDLHGGLQQAIGSVTQTSDEMRAVAVKVRNILTTNEDRINRLLAQSEETLSTIQQTAQAANEIVGDPQVRRQWRDAMARVPELIQDVQQTVRRLDSTVALVDRNLDNVEDFTAALGNRGPRLIEQLDHTTQKLDQVMSEILVVSRALNNQQGTVGRLIHDPELYYRLNRAAQNIDELTRQLQPIVADVRVITDKVARHPGVVLRDAVRPGPGIK